MPAAAVIPASVAYIKVVAVKKLVVAFLARGIGPTFIVGTRFSLAILEWSVLAFSCRSVSRSSFTVRKLECSKQAYDVEYISME